MNDSQLYYCNICDKTIKFKNKSNHDNSHAHKHKEKFSILVKVYEINNPQIYKDNLDQLVASKLMNAYKLFHTYKYECIYDLNYMNTNSYSGNLSILLKEREYKYQLYGLHKKLKNIETGTRVFLNIEKITVKIYSSITNINKRYYLKLNIPIMHRQFFKIISKNPEYIKNFCTDMENPFHLACHNWYFYNNPLDCQGCYQKDCNVRFCGININIDNFV